MTEKPPAIPPLPRARKPVQEINRAPILGPKLDDQIATINTATIRKVISAIPRFKPTVKPGDPYSMWGDPEVVLMQQIFYEALNRVACLSRESVYAEIRARMHAPARTTAVSPKYDADATTEPMTRRMPDLGDE